MQLVEQLLVAHMELRRVLAQQLRMLAGAYPTWWCVAHAPGCVVDIGRQEGHLAVVVELLQLRSVYGIATISQLLQQGFFLLVGIGTGHVITP
ncbi:hypothetical protein CIW53_04920 [Rhodanobacter sp. T12-5]|nr:hypothetical protein CIW53_04920 [Rhodanobacter sp. T12-5]